MIGLFRSSPPHSVPRPALWRLSLIQCLAWILAVALFALLWPGLVFSIIWAGPVALLAQGFWIWSSLRGYGDPGSARYLAGATVGLLGKWAIILVGLVALWRGQPDLSVPATAITVFALNTLAALAAPVFITQAR